MRLIFSQDAWEDYLYWQKNDRKLLNRVNLLIRDILRAPFEGVGAPEPLKHGLTGYWSRRINGEHRLVHKVEGESVMIAQCRYHY